MSRLRTHSWSTALLSLVLVLAVATPASAEPISSTPERSWTVDGRVFATVIVGDTLYVGGNFRQARSPSGETVRRDRVAAFSLSTGELVRGFVANAGSAVRALATDGQSLYVGGHFGRVNGVVRTKIAKVSLTTGSVDPTFEANANDGVLALEYSGGELYAGGKFTEIGGSTRTRVAKLDPVTGTVDSAFRAAANRPVLALEKHPTQSVLYVAGRLTQLSGVSRAGVGAVSSTTGDTTSLVFSNSVRPTLDLALNDTGTQLFGALGAFHNNVTAWSTSSGARQWHHRVEGDTQAVEHYGGRVFFGFHDGFQGDSRLKLLAADAATGALWQDFRPRIDSFWGVFSIAASENGLVAGGEFTEVSGVPAQGFVRFVGNPGE